MTKRGNNYGHRGRTEGARDLDGRAGTPGKPGAIWDGAMGSHKALER